MVNGQKNLLLTQEWTTKQEEAVCERERERSLRPYAQHHHTFLSYSLSRTQRQPASRPALVVRWCACCITFMYSATRERARAERATFPTVVFVSISSPALCCCALLCIARLSRYTDCGSSQAPCVHVRVSFPSHSLHDRRTATCCAEDSVSCAFIFQKKVSQFFPLALSPLAHIRDTRPCVIDSPHTYNKNIFFFGGSSTRERKSVFYLVVEDGTSERERCKLGRLLKISMYTCAMRYKYVFFLDGDILCMSTHNIHTSLFLYRLRWPVS
jgi:hypothetical protein